MVRFRFDDQDFFEVDPVRYADALGDLGLAAYRREVKQRIEAGGGDSFGAKYAQERLAMLDGDAEALVGLLGGDLSRPYQFIRVAEAMAELGRDDDILSRGCLAGARGPSGLGSGAAAVVALGRGP
ncbi:MAG: hypothetical protein M0T80_11540 [Actinomycetota bacterium]|nr:hypothetical protein [Actinomycetota bacterium]